jgi:hypothetical protein
MARRFLRFLLPSGLLLAVVLLVRRTVHLREELCHVVPSRDPWPPITEGGRTEPLEATPEVTREEPAAWLAPVDGACPPTHPIKAKEASGIYQPPGMVNYNRTRPDRCYAEESAAQADGFTKAKR